MLLVLSTSVDKKGVRRLEWTDEEGPKVTASTVLPSRHPDTGVGHRLESAHPSLVTPGALDRELPVHTVTPAQGGLATSYSVTGGWWLLGTHGGAGVTSLIRSGVAGCDAGRMWPATAAAVVTAARRTAYGLEWARDAARQHASGGVPDGVVLAGLVVVADAPGRVPRRIARFLDLVAAAYPRVWEIPWVEEWRLAGHSEPLPLPPAARRLDKDMQAQVVARRPAEGLER